MQGLLKKFSSWEVGAGDRQSTLDSSSAFTGRHTERDVQPACGMWHCDHHTDNSTGFLSFPLFSDSHEIPTIPELINFSLSAQSKVNLLQEVGTKYKSFGTLLLEDANGSKMAAIEHDLGRNVEDINYKVFQEWICGNGKKPVSWDTLIGVLQDIEMVTLAKSLRDVKCEVKMKKVPSDERVESIKMAFK